MSPRVLVLECIAVLAGAVIAVLVAGLVAWLFIAGVDFLALIASPGQYVVALVTVAIFAVLYAYLPKTPATLASLGVGIVLPTILASFIFDASLGWGAILFVNLVFALVALSIYRFVHANGETQAAARGISDRL